MHEYQNIKLLFDSIPKEQLIDTFFILITYLKNQSNVYVYAAHKEAIIVIFGPYLS